MKTKEKMLQPSKKVTERCANAKEMAKQMDRVFVASTFKYLFGVELVKIKVPSAEARHMRLIDEHELLVFEGTALNNLVMIKIATHYAHGDFPIRNAEGKLRPSVIRHFYVDPLFLGEDIVASVEVKEKKDLLTGERTIVIDIVQIIADGRVTVEHALCLGSVDSLGIKEEVKIPGNEKYIRIEKTNPVQIFNDISAAEERKIAEINRLFEGVDLAVESLTAVAAI